MLNPSHFSRKAVFLKQKMKNSTLAVDNPYRSLFLKVVRKIYRLKYLKLKQNNKLFEIWESRSVCRLIFQDELQKCPCCVLKSFLFHRWGARCDRILKLFPDPRGYVNKGATNLHTFFHNSQRPRLENVSNISQEKFLNFYSHSINFNKL